MGKRGPQPKPTALKKLQGNPGRRPLNQDEPKPAVPTHLPKPPDVLGEAGKREWSELCALLQPLGLLTKLDLRNIRLYCEAFERYLQASEGLRRGFVIASPNNYPILNPNYSILKEALATMRSIMAEFGMSPSTRSRIAVKRDKTETPILAPTARGEDEVEADEDLERLRQKYMM